MQSKLNSITGEKFGYFFDHPKHSVSSESWATTFTLMFENLFKDAANYEVKFPFNPNMIRTFLKKSNKALNDVKTASFVHWDLWLGNIFVNQLNGRWELEGIIDFERTIFGDPLTESSLRGSKKRANLMKGYGKDLFATENARIRDALYDLYLATTLLVEMFPRQYNPMWRILYKIYARSLWKPALKFLKNIHL
jgi:fructosamine-3-kinase